MDLKFGMPGLTHEQLVSTIELYGNHVIPRVRQLLATDTAEATIPAVRTRG